MRYYPIAFFLFLFQSCLEKNNIPPGVLSKDKMQSVLWDMLRADQFVIDNASRDSLLNKEKKSIELYEQVFKVHHITKNDFQKSLDFYQGRPDLLKIIIDSITNQQRVIMEKQYQSKPDTVNKKIKPV